MIVSGIGRNGSMIATGIGRHGMIITQQVGRKALLQSCYNHVTITGTVKSLSSIYVVPTYMTT